MIYRISYFNKLLLQVWLEFMSELHHLVFDEIQIFAFKKESDVNDKHPTLNNSS